MNLCLLFYTRRLTPAHSAKRLPTRQDIPIPAFIPHPVEDAGWRAASRSGVNTKIFLT